MKLNKKDKLKIAVAGFVAGLCQVNGVGRDTLPDDVIEFFDEADRLSDNLDDKTIDMIRELIEVVNNLEADKL